MSTDSSKQEMDTSTTSKQAVLKELQAEPECLKYAEKWMENGVEPAELLHFISVLSTGSKPSWSSWLKLPKAQKAVSVGVVVTGETFGAHERLLEQVKEKHLKWTGLDGGKLQCQSIIIFCPITSRAGSDVEAAMSTPAVSASDKPVVLVLLHHTRDVDYSTAGRRCAEKFPRVVSEVHFLFHETQPGLLPCPQNHQSTRDLKQALSRTTSPPGT